MMDEKNVDIQENEIFKEYPEVMAQLLRDHTTGKNIFWATHDYENLGPGYEYDSEITIESITGKNGFVVKPRVLKSKDKQASRAKGMAEVFTPSWICNAQNNLLDNCWFEKENVFNIEDAPNRTWKAIRDKIIFPEGKTWKDYVRDTRLEITCGEAPYIVSRYDTTTGVYIPLEERIGLLDRKLRVINENVDVSGEWLDWTQIAYKNTFAYEWQGDNLLLAREAMLLSFIEYYQAKFGKKPLEKSIKTIAYIISWNVWQMDGLKCVVPNSCKNGVTDRIENLFGYEEVVTNCQGCQSDNMHKHNGIYCLLRDWGVKDPKTGENNMKIRFVDLLKK